ncbi:hypothetical protein B0T19DRAFT_429212 [Cercophora scortea]|uniref:Uncharacterized protein n=1 Tax=Cercophora scortea TaxID=314031 RepID=A0AAE0IGP4_9PEZI|nr:hypothetical protein B0T19DRAFT_429212 [Cercophora scortea]
MRPSCCSCFPTKWGLAAVIGRITRAHQAILCFWCGGPFLPPCGAFRGASCLVVHFSWSFLPRELPAVPGCHPCMILSRSRSRSCSCGCSPGHPENLLQKKHRRNNRRNLRVSSNDGPKSPSRSMLDFWRMLDFLAGICPSNTALSSASPFGREL